jgi:hypothetical protein
MAKTHGSNLLRTKESKDRIRVANYTVDGGRRISSIAFGQPRYRTALKRICALGLSMDSKPTARHTWARRNNNEVFARKTDVREVSTLIVKGAFLWK